MITKLLSATFPLGLILCGAGAAALMKEPGQAVTKEVAAPKIAAAATYYLFISEIELYPEAMDDDGDLEKWDSGDGPDIFYTVHSNESEIFREKTRKDSFIANWRGVTVPVALGDLKEVVKGDIGVDIEIENIISAARVKGDAKLVIQIYDEDTQPNPNDAVGELLLNVSELKEGDNVFTNPELVHNKGWKSITVKLVKREGSVKDFLYPLLRDISGSAKP